MTRRRAAPDRELFFAVPGDPDTLTGGYVYAKRLAEALPDAGWKVNRLRLPNGFPHPDAAALQQTATFLAATPADATIIVDGLAFGALPADLLRGLLQQGSRRLVALVHHPLAQESGIDAATAARLRASEQAALALAHRLIVTSPHTQATLIADYGVPAGGLSVAIPGTDPGVRARGSSVPQLLTVATLTPRKGHEVLLRAYARITDLAWSALWVGSRSRDPATAETLAALIASLGLARRVRFAGELQDGALDDAYAASDLFVLPSHHEGYGMVFAEALARGLPVVATRAGAIPDTVPAECGLLVPPGDDEALAGALRRVLTEPSLHTRLADAAWRYGQTLPDWDDTAARVAEALA